LPKASKLQKNISNAWCLITYEADGTQYENNSRQMNILMGFREFSAEFVCSSLEHTQNN
jgi:hypothetical protein